MVSQAREVATELCSIAQIEVGYINNLGVTIVSHQRRIGSYGGNVLLDSLITKANEERSRRVCEYSRRLQET
jgi:hypothetical protein